MKNYNCFTCQDPLKISIHFHTYIRANGPQRQKCYNCNAVHEVDEKNNIRLVIPGERIAALSPVFSYPEYKPHRVGAYPVQYSNGTWSKMLATWDGEVWRNGPVLFHEGSIIAWQGLAGDMEHLKRIPGHYADPLPEQLNMDDDE